jgi:hypothetical protein
MRLLLIRNFKIAARRAIGAIIAAAATCNDGIAKDCPVEHKPAGFTV